jgi:hypothetical protein
MNVIYPMGMTAMQWTDAMALDLNKFGACPRLAGDDGWREWALVILGFPAISDINAPDPYGFDDWRSWAERFNQVYSVLSN